MTNPLIAERQDSTQAFSGDPILESVNDTSKAIASGDWASGVLGAAGTALDALSMALDPFGAIFAAGVGWLMEHVGPLSDALDELTGDPDQIKAHAETWKNISTELGSISTDLSNMVANDTSGWTGEAADAYRQRATDTANLLTATQSAADGASSGISTAGEVVAAVRTLVRDIIAELVGHLVSWALQVLFTLGIGLTWVVPQVIAEVAKVANRIGGITTKLVKALSNLAPMLKKLDGSFDEVSKALKNLKKSDPKPTPKPNDPPPNTRGFDNPKDGDGSTTPNSNKDNGSTNPNSHQDNGSTNPNSNKDNGPTNSNKDNSDKGPDNNSNKGPNNDSSPPPPPPKNNNSNNNSTTPNSNKPNPPRDRAVPDDSRNCKSDPVDIATGEMILSETDLELRGTLTLRLLRTHVSSYRAGRWFGPSWSSTLDQRLEFDDQDICYFSPDGMVLVYPIPDTETSVMPVEGPRLPLSVEDDGTYTITDHRRGEALHFGARRGGMWHGGVLPLRAITNHNDQRIDIEYDASGVPAILWHSSGEEVGIRAERGRITEIRVLGSAGSADIVVASYHYNDLGQLTKVVNSSGAPTLFDYDAEGRMTGWQDRNGIWYRYVYDHDGRCVQTVGAGGYLDGTFTYDRERLVTTYTDSLGHTTTFQLNNANQTIR